MKKLFLLLLVLTVGAAAFSQTTIRDMGVPVVLLDSLDATTLSGTSDTVFSYRIANYAGGQWSVQISWSGTTDTGYVTPVVRNDKDGLWLEYYNHTSMRTLVDTITSSSGMEDDQLPWFEFGLRFDSTLNTGTYHAVGFFKSK